MFNPKEVEVLSYNSYYAFGWSIPGKSYNRTDYRYDFNGKPTDYEIGWQDYGMRMYDARVGRFLSIDPLANKNAGISPYAFCFNNPLIYIDPDGQDGILVIFPDYKVDPELKISVFGKTFQAPKLSLGHAGVLLIDNKTGITKYYEYGRYPTSDGTKGRVRNITVPNVVVGEDGKPTQESLNKVLGVISYKSGDKGRIQGAYVEGDFNKMNNYAQQKLKESNPKYDEYDKNRESYDLINNNCGTLDVMF